MVADTNKTQVMDMFETMTQNARKTMDASRRMQDSWLTTMTNFNKDTDMQNGFSGPQAQMAKSWFSLMSDNMQRFSEATMSCCQTGMEVSKVACDVATNMNTNDVYTGQRKVMDTAFQAMQTNMDTMNKAGKAAADGWASLTKTKVGSCCDTGSTKATAKGAK